MFRYKLHWADGSEAGEASYAVNITPGELIWIHGSSNLINSAAGVNAFHGNVNDAIAGCEEAGMQAGG